MPKQRLNITVDEWVAEELKRRDDINISGAANDFFIEYLGGKDKDQAAKEMRVQRLQREEKEHEQEAQKKRGLWKQIKEEIEQQQESKKEELKRLQKVPDDESHPLVQRVANQLDMTPSEALEESKNL